MFNSDGSIWKKATDGSELETMSGLAFLETSSMTSYGNTKAKDIEKFKKSVNENGGYYIARYEASNNSGQVGSKSGVAVWNNITQIDAARLSKNMYDNSNFESDLINSYAWDTAIVFIQTYSNKAYAGQTSLNEILSYTGEREDGTTDKVCNIYDMASNCMEWTTETQMYNGDNCVFRGGNYLYNSTDKTDRRGVTEARNKHNHISFRVIIYI